MSPVISKDHASRGRAAMLRSGDREDGRSPATVNDLAELGQSAEAPTLAVSSCRDLARLSRSLRRLLKTAKCRPLT